MPSICGKEDQQWDAGSVCPGLSSNRNKPADGSKVATPRSFHRTLSRRRTREHALHHLTLNFSQTFRAEASSQQAEVHLQAPPTLTSSSFGSTAVTWMMMENDVCCCKIRLQRCSCVFLLSCVLVSHQSLSDVQQQISCFSVFLTSWFYCLWAQSSIFTVF